MLVVSPLGIFIRLSEDQGTIMEGLELLKLLVGMDCFGRGQAGPCVLLTDDFRAES